VIKDGSSFKIEDLNLSQLRVYENQERYPDRVLHYVKLLKEHPDEDPGFILVKPRDGGYEILDGHHRYVAHILTGRSVALCIIITEPN
jgi:ParB-like nuclease domain